MNSERFELQAGDIFLVSSLYMLAGFDENQPRDEHGRWTNFGTTRQGPPAVSLETAKKRGYTEGPFYHSTDFAHEIERKGFLSKGAEDWERDDPGSLEEFKKWGTASPVMFARNIEDVVETDQHGAYGKEVITLYAKPGTVKDAGSMTLLGGFYVSDPAHVVPIKGSRKSALRKVRS